MHLPRCDVWLIGRISVDEELAEAGSIVGVDFVVRGQHEMPEGAFDPGRNQYDAHKLMLAPPGVLAPRGALGNRGMTLVITDRDIFVQELNFVFGVTDPSTERSVVSIARLVTGDRRVFHDRVVKEMVHEMGHAFGLRHCRYPCVMAFSQDITGVDRKGKEFCAKCRVILDASKPR